MPEAVGDAVPSAGSQRVSAWTPFGIVIGRNHSFFRNDFYFRTHWIDTKSSNPRVYTKHFYPIGLLFM